MCCFWGDAAAVAAHGKYHRLCGIAKVRTPAAAAPSVARDLMFIRKFINKRHSGILI
jgi:hypothetical protein